MTFSQPVHLTHLLAASLLVTCRWVPLEFCNSGEALKNQGETLYGTVPDGPKGLTMMCIH